MFIPSQCLELCMFCSKSTVLMPNTITVYCKFVAQMKTIYTFYGVDLYTPAETICSLGLRIV